jgi:hypothetical protein
VRPPCLFEGPVAETPLKCVLRAEFGQLEALGQELLGQFVQACATMEAKAKHAWYLLGARRTSPWLEANILVIWVTTSGSTTSAPATSVS